MKYLLKYKNISLNKIHLKMSSAQRQPFFSGLCVSTLYPTQDQFEYFHHLSGQWDPCLHIWRWCKRIILCMHTAHERQLYTVTPSLIGWGHTQNDPWVCRPNVPMPTNFMSPYGWMYESQGLKGCLQARLIKQDTTQRHLPSIFFDMYPCYMVCD